MPSSEVSPFEADNADWMEELAPGELPAVLMAGSVPRQFIYPPQALLSGCTSLTVVDFGILNWPSSAFVLAHPATNGYSDSGEARTEEARWTEEPRWSCSKRSVESTSLGLARLPAWPRSWVYIGAWCGRRSAVRCPSRGRRPSGHAGSCGRRWILWTRCRWRVHPVPDARWIRRPCQLETRRIFHQSEGGSERVPHAFA